MGSHKTLDVVIVGGSLGGLFAGVALKHAGHNVRILERSPQLLHDQGAGIIAGAETQAYFAKHDRTQTPYTVNVTFRHYIDKEGNEIHREDKKQGMKPSEEPTDGTAAYENGCTVTSVREKGSSKIEVDFTRNDGSKDTYQADVLVAADGPGSTIRKLFEPSVKREYAGYIAFRGTAPEMSLSERTYQTMVDQFTFFHAPAIQCISYAIPGEYGTLEAGQRLVNWVWYDNFEEGSTALDELMTDTDGRRHNVTLPVGKMRQDVWQRQLERADEVLAPQFAELFRKTEHPFIQAITDVISPRNVFMDGKILLMGDALAGFRPHTASSTSQAALDSRLLVQLLEGSMTLDEWSKQTMEFAQSTLARGIMMGNRSQFDAEFKPELLAPDSSKDIGVVGRPDWKKS